MPKNGKTEERIVGSLELSASREVRVALAIRDAGIYVDVRNYFLNLDALTAEELTVFSDGKIPNRDKMLPTPKGIQLKDEVFMELMDKLLVPLHNKFKERAARKAVENQVVPAPVEVV